MIVISLMRPLICTMRLPDYHGSVPPARQCAFPVLQGPLRSGLVLPDVSGSLLPLDHVGCRRLYIMTALLVCAQHSCYCAPKLTCNRGSLFFILSFCHQSHYGSKLLKWHHRTLTHRRVVTGPAMDMDIALPVEFLKAVHTKQNPSGTVTEVQSGLIQMRHNSTIMAPQNHRMTSPDTRAISFLFL